MAAGDLTAKNATISLKDCAVFDGVDDYVEIPHHESQLGSNLSNGFTISAWINPRSAAATAKSILDKSATHSSTAGFHFLFVDSNRIYFRMNEGLGRFSENNAITPATWQHVLLTVSSGQLANFYVNGVLRGPANQDLEEPISAITTTNVMRIGNRATATDRTFDGGIKDVKMWNRVLTTDEIAQDYAGLIPVTSGLILDVPLERDYTEKAKGLTLTNSGSYLNYNLPQKVLSDVNCLTLGAVTDKVFIVGTGFPQFHVLTSEREE